MNTIIQSGIHKQTLPGHIILLVFTKSNYLISIPSPTHNQRALLFINSN